MFIWGDIVLIWKVSWLSWHDKLNNLLRHSISEQFSILIFLSRFRSNSGPWVDQVRVRGVQRGRLQGGRPLPLHLHHGQLQPRDQPRQRPDYCHNTLMRDTLERTFYHVKREGFPLLLAAALLQSTDSCQRYVSLSDCRDNCSGKISAHWKAIRS